jgi:xanthine dehydrogenase YagR molybdenum-binding subunit
MKAKGVAELGICGVAAAAANAIYSATGVRVRDDPITLDSSSTACRQRDDRSAWKRARP